MLSFSSVLYDGRGGWGSVIFWYRVVDLFSVITWSFSICGIFSLQLS